MSPSLSRLAFSARVIGACAAAFAGPRAAGAAGAVSGSWCAPLTKAARGQLFDFSLELLDPKGTSVFTLSDYTGRPVWVQFFASWCPPCNNEMPDVVRIAAQYGDAIQAIGIDVQESVDRARGFRDRHRIPFPIALDKTGKVFDIFGAHAIPMHVFFDSRGGISCISNSDLTPKQMDNELAVALSRSGGFPATATTSKPV